MTKGKLRMVGVELSRPNDYVIGRIIGIAQEVIIDEEIKDPLIIWNPEYPECYAIKLWATDEEWRRLIKSLKKLIPTGLAEIRFFKIKSKSKKEES